MPRGAAGRRRGAARPPGRLEGAAKSKDGGTKSKRVPPRSPTSARIFAAPPLLKRLIPNAPSVPFCLASTLEINHTHTPPPGFFGRPYIKV